MTKIPGSTLIDVVGLYLVCSSYIVSFDLLAIVPRMYTLFPASQRHQKAKTKLCSFHVLFDKLEALETFYPNNSSAREGPFYPYPLCQWISSSCTMATLQLSYSANGNCSFCLDVCSARCQDFYHSKFITIRLLGYTDRREEYS